MLRRLAVALVAMLVLVGDGGTPAGAYVRSRTDTASLKPFFWTNPRQVLEVSSPAPVTGVSEKELRAAAQVAVSSWSTPAVSCTAVSLRLAGSSTASQTVGQDGRNRIIMRTGDWCVDPLDPSNCHPMDAVAITNTFWRNRPGSPKDGELVQADIELNASGDFQWATIPDVPLSGRDFSNSYDLATVLTHEMGHFLGFAHTCLSEEPPRFDNQGNVISPELDDEGNVVPLCATLPPEKDAAIRAATMFPYMEPLLVTARTLSDDDLRASCEVYPIAGAPLYEWVGGGGCAHAPLPPGGGTGQAMTSLALVLVLVLFSILFSPSGRGQRQRARARNSAPMPRNPPIS